MEDSKKTKEIIKIISGMRAELLIEQYIKENIPNELLEDEEFVKKLTDANPLVKEVLRSLNIDIEREKIIEEIRRVGLKAVIEDEEKLKMIPKEYKEQLYDLAKEYEEEEEFKKAKNVYARIIEFGQGQVYRFNARFNRNEENRRTIYYKSKYSYYRCKVQNGEELTEEDKEELSKLAKEDKDNILKLRTPGKMTEYDLFESLFEDIPEETLVAELLPYIPSGNTRDRGEPSDRPGTKDYIEELSPVNRLKFIKEQYDVTSYKIGRGKFSGYVIFSIKDSDVVIVEKFFEEKGRKGNKQVVPSKDASTFIVHKDAEIDLEKSGRSQLVEKRKSERGKGLPLIDRVYHRGVTYYDRVIEKFDKIEANGKKRRMQRDGLDQEDLVEEERTDTPYTEAKVEEQNAGNTSDSNNEEANGEEKEEFRIEVDKLKQYTIEELIYIAEQLDSEYGTLAIKVNEIEEKIQLIRNEIELISGNLESGIKGDLTKGNTMEAIKNGLAILAEGRKALLEAKQLKERALSEAAKNREIRDRITKEFNARIRGEE